MVEQLIHDLINMPDTFIGEAPVEIDDCQWIKKNAGHSTLYFGKENFDRPTFSIHIRRQKHKEAATVTEEIFKKLRNYGDANSALIATRLPAFVGKDTKHRTIYSFQLEYQTGGQ